MGAQNAEEAQRNSASERARVVTIGTVSPIEGSADIVLSSRGSVLRIDP
jgi:hypothetical protein